MKIEKEQNVNKINFLFCGKNWGTHKGSYKKKLNHEPIF